MAAKKKLKQISVSVGERVNFVMKDGQIRPLDIVRVWNDQGYVNGILLVDGSNDDGNIPFYGEGDVKVPHARQSLDPDVTVPLCHIWASSVMHDESKKPGTWHFGETEVEEEDEDEEEPAKPPVAPPAQPATAPAATNAASTANSPVAEQSKPGNGNGK